MKLVIPTLLLWASAIALLGGVALLCAIASDAVPVRQHLIPTPADMPQGQVLLCLTPLNACVGRQCSKPVVKT